MVTSQKSSLTLPELLFEHFTELSISDDGESFQIFNTLTSDYSKKEIRTIIEDPALCSIRCSSNERAVDIMVLRALGLRKKSTAPVVLVAKSEYKAREVLSVLDKQFTNARIANLFSQIRRKGNYTQYGTPDFIICSYHKLIQVLSQELSKNKRINVSGLVFLTPLSRSDYYSESIFLDQILNLLPKKAVYTFIHGEELSFRKEDLEWLFAGTAITYKREEYTRRDLLKDFRLDLFEDRNLVSAALKKNAYPSTPGVSCLLKLILTATLSARKNLKELKAVIKNSICYKLWLTFEQAFPENLEEKIAYSIDQLRLILRYLTTTCRVKLLELKENYCYKMTDKGRQFFHRFCFSDGLSVSLFIFSMHYQKSLRKGSSLPKI